MGTQPRKATSSAHHSKKPSQTINQPSQLATLQSKKSTKEKYIELKAMYDDLLERHYAQQKQLSQQQQQPQVQIDMGSSQQIHQIIDVFNPQSNTPRITASNALSQQNLNQQSIYQQSNINLATLNQLEVIPKSLIINVNKNIKPVQNSVLMPKAVQKLNIESSQSRKAAQGNHKRSVSDGNEQLFKFKQQGVMQRYLYPQPSNQTLQAQKIQSNNEQAVPTNRAMLNTLQTMPYQQPSHQRRVSDDYLQKQKKSQKTSIQTENIGVDSNPEPKKLQTVDFNIKSFLLEMRNKHIVPQPKPQEGGGFINIVDEQQLHSYNPPSQTSSGGVKVKGNKFAMIIEENSPINVSTNNLIFSKAANGTGNQTLESSRRVSVIDDQYKQSKPIIDFTRVNFQKQKTQKTDRTHSPQPELQKPTKQSVATHKRVKSDIPEQSRKQQQYQLQSKGGAFNAAQQALLSSSSKNLINQKNYQNTKQGIEIQQLINTNDFYLASDKTTPKKGFIQKKTSGNNLINKKNQLEQSIGGNKVINVSIDLIRDGLSAGGVAQVNEEAASYMDDSNDGPSAHLHQWNIAETLSNNNMSQELKPLKKQTNPKKGQKVFSGGSESIAKKDKYKKMFAKYDNTSRVEAQSHLNNNKSGNHQRKYTFDAAILSSSPNSNAHSPLCHSPMLQNAAKNRFSINEKGDINQMSKKQLSSKIFLPISPKQIVPKQKVKFQNLMQPVRKGNIQTVQQPQNSMANPPPNNSAVNTQESPRPTQLRIKQDANEETAEINVKLIIPQPLSGIGERIETQDSAISEDPSLSPKTRLNAKLIRHIKRSFRQTIAAPQTSVDFYRIGKMLGKGAFGKVNLAMHKLSGRLSAVKSINKQYLSEEAQTKKIMQEVVILKRTRHRNIVRLYEFFETQKHILFVFELCAGGDLLNYVRRRRRLKEDVAKVIFKQIIEGLQYCHSKSIVHRDIKLDNILLDVEGEVKICDFGISKIVRKGEIMTEQCGTPAYIAPEILKDKGYEGFQCDIWSAGVVLFAMLYGTVPFKANNMSELQQMILKAKFTLKDDVSKEAQDLLQGMLEKNPSKRLRTDQILQHEWLKDVNESIPLFSEQEKVTVRQEFAYGDSRLNRNENSNAQGDVLFTEHMLESTGNSLCKNATSKSVILAPFNSTRSNIGAPLSEEMVALIQSKNVIKFNARAREADVNYEKNFNAELDNGVYHKVEEEKEQPPEKPHHIGEDSLQNSFNKPSSIRSSDEEEQVDLLGEQARFKEKKKIYKKTKVQTELEKLESLIIQQEDDIDDNPYQEAKHPSGSQSQLLMDRKMLQTGQTLIIDDLVIAMVEGWGYPREYIIKCLNNNELNYATTGYFLLENRHSMTLEKPLII